MAGPILPLNALRAIEAVARLGGLEPAAGELGVTIGAVSQHIRRAEARLGLALFERTARGLRPSPALAAQLPLLRRGFAALESAATALDARETPVLTLTVGSVFASRWLVSRLGRFTANYPELEFRVVATGKLIDLDRPDIDCGIRFGGGDWPGVRAEPVGPRTMLPVAAPGLARRLKSPADLLQAPVILDEATMLSWARWFEAAGISPLPALNGPTYSDPSLAFDAAVAGQGVLLAVEMMAADALTDGRLMAPFPPVESEFGYWFATSASRHMPGKVRRFRDWLMAEVAATALPPRAG
ncbi:MAG TPA: LysR substrate-binding domain-containing protein [Devosia sp.]|nr:LysR substrate-binding domain-containing protein [Devosia sp.]